MYHVTTRGNRRGLIFLAERDNEHFLATVGIAARRFGWRCHGYCLMPNHYHLALETPRPNLSAAMQLVNGTYARWFNRRYGFEGHVFERRFHSVVLERTPHLLELSRYLALNPVRAGLCTEAAEWRWSSFRAIAGLATPPAFLAVADVLAHFGRTPEQARQRFVTFVGDAPPRPAST